VIYIVRKIKKKEAKTLVAIGLIGIIFLSTTLLSGCTQKQEGLSIVLIGRDSTSGTRVYFSERVMNNENFSQNVLDKSSNGAVQQTVAQTPGAIGYVGLGYVDSTVKALKINNITVSVENVLAGTYPISRDLYMFTKGEATEAAKEFIEYIQSTEGQTIVSEEGFVTLPTSTAYNSTGKTFSGILKVSGSTTVLPIADKAATNFKAIYPGLTVTLSGGGSGAGITAVSGGQADIGMSSRELQPSENNLGLVRYTIAKDGIAIIVNPENTYVDGLTIAQVKAIYKGEITNWKDLSK
jgi:phosphate transport system substrate-binding protein